MEVLEEPNAALRLSGLTLKNGWVVGERLKTGADLGGSGGFFSVSYNVSKDNKVAFLKAFDLVKAFKRGKQQGKSLVSVLAEQARAFDFETNLHDVCIGAKLKRVVRILDHGEADVPPEGAEQILQIPYMIMELADCGDVRSYLGRNRIIDLEMKLTYLKDVVLGIFQLHGVRIAHQDLKPSNIMIFGEGLAKVGDLGRASSQDHASAHDVLNVAGDISYAPPEQLYAHALNGWLDRRMRCDLYQFASIIVFVFFGRTLNSTIFHELPEGLRPRPFGHGQSSYEDVLPYLIDIFETAITQWEAECPPWLGKELSSIIRQCGHPDFKRRGAHKTLKQSVPQLGLDRFVSDFDRLIRIASIEARKEAARAKK